MLKNNPYMKAYLNIINESATINIEKYQQIASEIGGVYIPETNTIDCKGKKVKFNDNWLNDEGSFDFKLINTSNDWSKMFYECTKLTHLPDNFTIPNTVTDCNDMFCNCISLTHLPENFTIPNTVTDCRFVFYGCKSLTHLPDNFIIPNNVTTCDHMFYTCISLTHLSDNFYIPGDAIYDSIFYGCSKLENKDPESYVMWEI